MHPSSLHPQEQPEAPVDPSLMGPPPLPAQTSDERQVNAQINDAQYAVNENARRLGYDVHEMFHLSHDMMVPSQRTQDSYERIRNQQRSNLIQAASTLTVPKFEYVPTASGFTVAPTDAVLDEDGRTYHGYKEGAYFLPNDGEEQDRLDIQHHATALLLDGQLATAPIPKPFTGHALDIGTGTGIWAYEFAEQNPGATVIGTDLSGIQPERPSVPNCSFVKQDAEDSNWLLGPDDKPVMFDYIHSRFMVTCFNSHLKVFKNAYENLNPGGWIELQDVTLMCVSDDGSTEGTAYEIAVKLAVQGGEIQGRDFLATARYKEYLIEAGFVDVTEERLLQPMGCWPSDPKMKEVARFMAEDAVMGMRSAGKLFRLAGMPQDALEKLPWVVRQEMSNPALHFGWPYYVICGRKPFDSEIQPKKKQRSEHAESGGSNVKHEPAAKE